MELILINIMVIVVLGLMLIVMGGIIYLMVFEWCDCRC